MPLGIHPYLALFQASEFPMRRFSKQNKYLMAAATLLAVLITCHDSYGRGRHGVRVHRSYTPHRRVVTQHPRSVYYGRYPKYYGGFHARYYQDIGVPPGDVGIRGNGIYQLPW